MNKKIPIEDLPFHILIQIFKYLTAFERNNASETCHSWYYAANDYVFLKKKFVFCKSLKASSAENNPLRIFLNSKRDFCNYSFKLQNISEVIDDFWVHLGFNIKVLAIFDCELSNTDVGHILKSCKNLQRLSFACKFVWNLNRSQVANDETNYELPNLKCIVLSNSELSDAIFNELVRYCPAIEKLYLLECYLTYETDLSENHETDSLCCVPLQSESPSSSKFTFRYVMNFIKTRCKKIKHLSLDRPNDSALIALRECRDLVLESLELNLQLTKITLTVLTDLLTKNSLLKELQFGDSTIYSDELFLFICRHLTNLQYLYIGFRVTDFGIKELHKLEKLKTLYFPQSSSTTSEGIKQGLGKEKNYTLKHLCILSHSNINNDGIKAMAENFPNLSYFFISSFMNTITEASLYTIFKYQTQLESLTLTDGIGVCDLEKENEEPSQPDISCLKRLKHLTLQGCRNITNETIKRLLRLPSLLTLDLTGCNNITHESYESIVRHCPNIEDLKINYCKNIKNETVVLIMTNLKKLRNLSLFYCEVSMVQIKTQLMRSMNMNTTEVSEYMQRIIMDWTKLPPVTSYSNYCERFLQKE